MAPANRSHFQSKWHASPGTVEYHRLYDECYFRDYLPEYESAAFRQRRVMYRQEYERITRYIRSGRVLDVGCGCGDFLELFTPSRWERFGMEVAPVALEVLDAHGIQTDLAGMPDESFDLVIFRGTIQHLDEPITTIKRCIRWLHAGGYMVFLATPNIGSLYYRLFQELPAIDPPRNFMQVSDRILQGILENLGMEVLRFEFPYRGTPYARPIRDAFSFVLRFLGVRRDFAFWGNMLECYARKPPRPPRQLALPSTFAAMCGLILILL
ncbi:MAG TPA: class I SAM-dependent methyltransferase [Gemmatimonadaceae bacterium]|jgi:SAM-dependent methyltransferase|nr:class I SAM-dependent methyltransferase [Gemmatimonadaceae bacterium]